jgi:hypothetical protein
MATDRLRALGWAPEGTARLEGFLAEAAGSPGVHDSAGRLGADR